MNDWNQVDWSKPDKEIAAQVGVTVPAVHYQRLKRTSPPSQELQLTATVPDEIGQAQISLIDWTRAKLDGLRLEQTELQSAYDHAEREGWASSALKRQCQKCQKRIEFYEKMLTALENGYVIVPNFPVTVFAVRTDREKPLKLISSGWSSTHEQVAQTLPASEGEYKNPFPVIYSRDYTTEEQRVQGKTNKLYWAEEWKDLEFPIQMAKPLIMQATSRAMALKAFDDFGILPAAKREDPIIVARLLHPSSTKYYKKWVTFMVAWHLNTRDL